MLASEETIEREFNAFAGIKNNSPKYVLSLDGFGFSRDGIIHLNIVDFLPEKQTLAFLNKVLQI